MRTTTPLTTQQLRSRSASASELAIRRREKPIKALSLRALTSALEIEKLLEQRMELKIEYDMERATRYPTLASMMSGAR